jgi:hypothetical protein
MKKVLCLLFTIFACSTAAFAYDNDNPEVIVSLGEFVVTDIIDTKEGKKYILSNDEAIVAVTCNNMFSHAYLHVAEGFTTAKLRMQKSERKEVVFLVIFSGNVVTADEFQFIKKQSNYIF